MPESLLATFTSIVKHASSKNGEWVSASQLKVSDQVLTVAGSWQSVTAVNPVDEEQTVYNFEVEDNHDYFVGKSGLLVHNLLCLGKTDGLQQFADEVGGDTYLDRPGIQNLGDVADTITSGEDIAVQLEESPGVIAEEVGNVQSGVNGVNPTAFEQELQWISENPEFWNQITWYEGLNVVVNPFW